MEATETILSNWAELRQKSPMLKAAVELLKAMEEVNSSTENLIVGGAVRDIILGKDPKDIDIATNMSSEELTRHFKTHEIGQSKDFGIHTVTWEGYQFETAHFRSEIGSSDNRRPDEVTKVDSFEEDSKRRDITFNSLGMNEDGVIIDYHNGIEDLNNKIVRTVGNAQERFKEDGLRILRAGRQAAQLGFKIESKTKEAMKELKHLIDDMPGERIHGELFKAAASGKTLADYLIHLDEAEILEKILPEIKALQRFKHFPSSHPEGATVTDEQGNEEPYNDIQNPAHADPSKYKVKWGTVWDHIISALRHSKATDPVSNLSVLLHDIAKATTFTETPEGKPQYKGHEHEGLPLVDIIAARLKFSTEEKQAIKFAMEHHMHGHRIKEMAPSKLIAMRHSPHWEHLRHTFYSDDASRLHKFDENEFNDKMEHIENLYKTFGERQEFEKKMAELINGQMIIQLVPGIKGPEIGRIKDAIRKWIIDVQFQVTQDQVVERIKELA